VDFVALWCHLNHHLLYDCHLVVMGQWVENPDCQVEVGDCFHCYYLLLLLQKDELVQVYRFSSSTFLRDNLGRDFQQMWLLFPHR